MKKNFKIFIFTLLSDASKDFMKAFKATKMCKRRLQARSGWDGLIKNHNFIFGLENCTLNSIRTWHSLHTFLSFFLHISFIRNPHFIVRPFVETSRKFSISYLILMPFYGLNSYKNFEQFCKDQTLDWITNKLLLQSNFAS